MSKWGFEPGIIGNVTNIITSMPRMKMDLTLIVDHYFSGVYEIILKKEKLFRIQGNTDDVISNLRLVNSILIQVSSN